MELLIIVGPPAVGKMAVGMELEKITGFKLFHNHMVIELVHEFFEFGTPSFGKLVGEFRTGIFGELAASDFPGLIFTYVWAFDEPSDEEEIRGYCERFGKRMEEAIFVELFADQETRLQRNVSELRLAQKKTKRNIEQSERNLLESDSRYRLNTTGNFPYSQRYLRIDNSRRSAKETAECIKDHFKL